MKKTFSILLIAILLFTSLSFAGEEKPSGFDLETNQTIQFCGVEFSIPACYDGFEEDEDGAHIYYVEGRPSEIYFGAVELFIRPDLFKKTAAKMNEEAYADFKENGEVENVEFLSSEWVRYDQLYGQLVHMKYTRVEKGEKVFNWYFTGHNPFLMKVFIVGCNYVDTEQLQYDYCGDFINILETAKFVD
jgi:hypothetical protein